MTREKVIEGLRKAAEELARYAPMKVNGRCQMYFDGAIHLLKEQEPVKPVETWNTYLCGNCNRNVYHEESQGCLVLYEERYTYCPNCGRKVKWDAAD